MTKDKGANVQYTSPTLAHMQARRGSINVAVFTKWVDGYHALTGVLAIDARDWASFRDARPGEPVIQFVQASNLPLVLLIAHWRYVGDGPHTTGLLAIQVRQ
eukprot:6490795-Amphidinium_carterae.1